MMNRRLLQVVTPPSIYHGCSIWKTFWEEKSTGEENFALGEFTAVNMKNGGRCNVRKYRDIKDSDKYTTLDISLKFGSLDNIRIIYSETKENLGNIRKWVDYLSGSQGQSKAEEIQRGNLCHWKCQYEVTLKVY